MSTRVKDWKTGESPRERLELRRQLSELEKQLIDLQNRFEAHLKASP